MAKQTIKDRGVTKDSTIDAHVPSAFAKRALFYLVFSGEFICNKNYLIDRSNLEMYLLIYVRRGSMRCELEGAAWTVGPQEIAIIDCRRPHRYYSDADQTEFQWFHFDGVGCRAYYERIKGQNLLHCANPSDSTAIHISSILQMMRQPFFREQTASILVHSILRDISEQSDNPEDIPDEPIRWAVEYLYNHYAENILVDDIADLINMSKYHFIRSFKRSINSTPHEFLINIRVRRAMELLSGSDKSIEAISAGCGFNSPSHFARCFKNIIGTTPGAFRKLHQASMRNRPC